MGKYEEKNYGKDISNILYNITYTYFYKDIKDMKDMIQAYKDCNNYVSTFLTKLLHFIYLYDIMYLNNIVIILQVT